MAFVRQCGLLFHGLSRIHLKYQVKILPKLPIITCERGYVRIYCTNESGGNSQTINNVVQLEELNNHLQMLNIHLTNLQIPYYYLRSALRLYSSFDNVISPTDIFLLSCCEFVWDLSLPEKQHLTRGVWELLSKKCKNLTLEHYHTILHVCAANKIEIDPDEFLKAMKIEPEEKTYMLLLQVAAKTGDLSGSAYVISKMKELNFSLSMGTLNLVLEVYITHGDMAQAQKTLNSFIASGVEPDNSMFASIAVGYAATGDCTNVMKVLNTHSFKRNDLSRIISTLCTTTSNNVISVLENLEDEVVHHVLIDPTFTMTISELVNLGKIDDASSIVKYCMNHVHYQSHKLVITYLKILVIKKVSQEFILKEFEEFKKIGFDKKIGDIILLQLLEESLRYNKKLSLNLLRELKKQSVPIRSHYFWPLFIRASGKKAETMLILENMLELNVPIDHHTLLEYVIPNIITLDPSLTFIKLKRFKITTPLILTSLLCYLLNKGAVKEAVSLYNSKQLAIDFNEIIEPLAKSYQLTKDFESCLHILSKAPKEKDFAGNFLVRIVGDNLNKINEEVLERLIESFSSHKIAISNFNAEVLAQQFEDKFSPNSLNLLDKIVNNCDERPYVERLTGITHPKNMNLQALECYLIESKSKNMNSFPILRKLIVGYCKNENLERAEEIRKEIEESQEPLWPSMKAYLFELYAKKGRINEVCELCLDLKTNHPNFAIDPYKIMTAARACVEQGKIGLAFEIIETWENARWAHSYGAWQLLDSIARHEGVEFVQKMLKILINKGFCEANATTLGPLIRPFIIKKDWEAAVKKFQEIFHLYGKLPLKQELIEGLIEAERQEVDIVLGAMGKCYKENIIKQYLISAYAKLGRKKELTDILKTAGPFQKQFIKLHESTDIKLKFRVASNILEASESIENFNRQGIYELLLSYYMELEDRRGMKALYERVLEDQACSMSFRNKFMGVMSSLNLSQLEIKQRVS